jgi:molybdopterin/thiamine biosynthesis adenylyltransferase
VGFIRIVDRDVPELSNLQRQIVHSTDRVGEPKTESARTFINQLNPDINVIGYVTRMSRCR